jgi:Ca2+-binding RTX toxin-like protein
MGLDIYAYAGDRNLLGTSNDGEDTILDADGKGVLRYTYKPLIGALQSTVIADASKKAHGYKLSSSDDRFTYELVSPGPGRSDLVVTINGDADGRLTLKDFRNGDFGIRLRQPRLAPNYGNPSNVVTGGDDSRIRLRGPRRRILIEVFGADDTVHGGAGNDLVLGGAQDDFLFGDADHDRIHGDAGRDQLDGGSGEDELFGGQDADILEGRDGSDLLVGEEGADLLAGGAGTDEIFAASRDALANALLFAEAGCRATLRASGSTAAAAMMCS